MTDSVRILALAAAQGRVRAPTYCATCGASTKGGKDRCLAHVLERDYPAQLVLELEAREREVLEVARRGWRAIHPESPILEDVRALVEVLEVTSIEKLSQHLIAELGPLNDGNGGRFRVLRRTVVAHYVDALVRARRARWISGKRRQQVTLTNPEAQSA